MLFFSILNPKIHSNKPGKYYKICNITALSILLIYLFSLSNSLSPTSFSFSGSLFVSHISLISPLSLSLSLPHNKIVCLRLALWRGEQLDGVRSAWRRLTWRSACCVFSCGCYGGLFLWFLWWWFLVVTGAVAVMFGGYRWCLTTVLAGVEIEVMGFDWG